jgi:hypothetical protein
MTSKSHYFTEEELIILKRLNNYLSKLSGQNISESKALGFLVHFADININEISSSDLKSEFNNYLKSSKKNSNLDSIVDDLFDV